MSGRIFRPLPGPLHLQGATRYTGISERLLLDIPLVYISDPSDLANPLGLGGIFGVPSFLWVAGNGDNPLIGPTLSATGSPSSKNSPWQLEDNSTILLEEYDGSSYRKTATVLDPGIADDVVVFGVAKAPKTGAVSYSTLLSTRGGVSARDYVVLYKHDSFRIDGFTHGDTERIVSSPSLGARHSLFTFAFIVDRDGLLHAGMNGLAQSGSACSAGSLAGGNGIGIAAYPSTSLPMQPGGGICFVAAVYGVGIADLWVADSYALFKEFSYRFSGVYQEKGAIGTFARGSAASWQDRNGIWHFASNNVPRAGDAVGLRCAPARINKCYNTINPQATTGWSVDGGTHSVIDDSSQLEADDADVWGPNVHRFVSGGSDQVVYGGAVTANTNPHSLSVIMRGDGGGESVDIGLRDVSSGVVQNVGSVALTTSWQRFEINGAVPADTDQQFALDCDAGDTIYFIASQLEEGSLCTTPIPNWATAAAAARVAETLTTAHTPQDEKGSIEATITPLGWSGGQGGTAFLIDRSGTSGYLIYPSSGGTYRFFDTSNQLVGIATPADGVAETVRTRWKGASRSIEDSGGRVSGSYTGSLRSSGTITIAPSAKESAIARLKAYQNGT